MTTPGGEPKKKWAYGSSREEVHEKYIRLQSEARKGPVATKVPTLAVRAAYWLREVVIEPNYAPLAVVTYETHLRLYILPYLGAKRLDKLTVRDVREWVNKLRKACQCCAQGKDTRRPVEHWNEKRRRHCCAVGQCCHQTLEESTVQKAVKILRSLFSDAISEDLVGKNPAAAVRLPTLRKRRTKAWSVDEARRFLENARDEADPLYAVYVLILVLGLRKGEVLGLDWKYVDLDAGELYVGEQLQRIRDQLRRRPVKTEDSEAPLPLPGICLAALWLRKRQQERDRQEAGDAWQGTGLVFTSPVGKPLDPTKFNGRFDARIVRAGVRRITVHGTRGTCATLLAALDVHPRVAMRVLRHSNIKMTMEVYTDATDEATGAALRKLGSALDG
ncbi:site-specific integrase [Nonomuraea sp. bgisy101]|uniref:site-specific integrase n=1 Tax=Nonomuraea sp. bgisy101 TaxID=3413784 RepID=UPI003D745862